MSAMQTERAASRIVSPRGSDVFGEFAESGRSSGKTTKISETNELERCCLGDGILPFDQGWRTNPMGDQQQKQGSQDRNQGNPNQRDQQAQQGGQDRNQGGSNFDRDKGRMGNKPGQGADQNKVGQDTDGDGKTVQPGQKPGQSHGTGNIQK